MRNVMFVAAALAAAAVAALLLAWPVQRSAVSPASEPRAETMAPTPAAALPAAPVLSRTRAGADAPVATLDFDTAVARLVDLSLRGIDEVERNELEKAKATDAEVGHLVAAVLERVADYDGKALFALTGLGPLDDQRGKLTRSVLVHFLHFGLQKHATAERAGNRAPLDGMLAALLDVMVPSEATATAVTSLLADQPYLHTPQESPLLRLAELVATYPWLATPVRRLLLTLWANLERSGARARDRIETLALMMKDDTNPARRAAALEQLLTSKDRSLVEFVLQDIEEQRDGARARELAQAAAAKLAPDVALDVVRRLRPLSPNALIAPAMDLVGRDAAHMRAAYTDMAAAGQHADLRADLVSAMGFHTSSENIAAVKAAFDRDPSADVRARALLALTANASAAFGERVVEAALADPDALGKGGRGLGTIVAALDNLARAGESDAVARLGQRLAARTDLPPDLRRELERLLQHGPDRSRGPPR